MLGIEERNIVSESIQKYRQVLEIDPRNTEALNGIARAFAAEGKLDLAMEYYRLALTIDPRNTDAMNGMAVMYWKGYGEPMSVFSSISYRGQSLANASQWFRRVLANDPENLAAVEGLKAVEECEYDLNQRIWSQEHDCV